MTRLLHNLTWIRDLAILGVAFCALWWWGTRGAAVGGKLAQFVQLLPGVVLLAPVAVFMCEVGARRSRRRWHAAVAAFLAASAAFVGGAQVFVTAAGGVTFDLFMMAVPAVLAVTITAWLSESAILDGRSHGVVSLLFTFFLAFGPFVLDRYFSEIPDLSRMTEERDLLAALSLPLICAGEIDLDLLRAPKVYTSFRLGEGVFRYPDAGMSIRPNLILAALLLVFGYLIPARLRRPF